MALMLGSVKFQAFDSSGNPLSGGKVYTYSPGTTTNKATYPTVADAIAATNANANPVILDSRGEANIVLAGKTKILLKDSSDATIYTVDNIEGDAASDVMDDNGNPVLKFTTTASAVNQVTIANAATGSNPTISATGTDSNIGLIAKTKGTGSFAVKDASDVSVLIAQPTASAVNQVTITSQITAVAPTIAATGTDSNIDLSLVPKGTGVVKIPGTSTGSATIQLYEDTDNGTNYVGIKAATSIASNLTYELPSAAPARNNQTLICSTAGVMSWSNEGINQSMAVTLSGAQTITTATYTKILFDSERFDTAGTFASNKWTPNVAGKYLVTLNVEYLTAADQMYTIAAIYKNGTTTARTVGHASGTIETGVSTSAILDMNGTTDYIEGYAYHAKGSNADISTSTLMTGAYIGT